MKRVWITGIQNLSALGLFVLGFHVGLNLLQLCSRALGRFISILVLEKNNMLSLLFSSPI